MSRSLIHLIDLTLLPAALMVVSKFIGIVVTISLFRIEWSLSNVAGSLWLVRPAVNPEQVEILSTYADLVMLLVLSFAFTFILVQATQFHETHIQPKLLISLHNRNLLGLVQSSYQIYHTATVWLIFMWLASGVIWLDVFFSATQAWVGILAVVAATIFTSILLQDVYREVDISKKSFGRTAALG
jgi:hypothetical protein